MTVFTLVIRTIPTPIWITLLSLSPYFVPCQTKLTLPGIEKWAYGVNLLDFGEQSRHQIFLWSFNKNHSVTASAPAFVGLTVPDQAECVISDRCSGDSREISEATTSFSDLVKQQSKERSKGFNLDFDVSAELKTGGVTAKVATKIADGFLFSETELSKQFGKSSSRISKGGLIASVYAEAYMCTIHTKSLSKGFITNVKKIHDDPSNANFKAFIKKFGTHFYKKFTLGAISKRAVFFTKYASSNTVESITNKAHKDAFTILNYKSETSTDSKNQLLDGQSNEREIEVQQGICTGGDCPSDLNGVCATAARRPEIIAHKRLPLISRLFEHVIVPNTKCDCSDPSKDCKSVCHVVKHFDDYVYQTSRRTIYKRYPCLIQECDLGDTCGADGKCIKKIRRTRGFTASLYDWSSLPALGSDYGQPITPKMQTFRYTFGASDDDDLTDIECQDLCDKDCSLKASLERPICRHYWKRDTCIPECKKRYTGAYDTERDSFDRSKAQQNCSTTAGESNNDACLFLHGAPAANYGKNRTIAARLEGELQIKHDGDYTYRIVCKGKFYLKKGFHPVEILCSDVKFNCAS